MIIVCKNFKYIDYLIPSSIISAGNFIKENYKMSHIKRPVITLKLLICILLCIVVSPLFVLVSSQEISKPSQKSDSNLVYVKKVRMTVRDAASFTMELNLMYDYGVYELSGNYNGDFDAQEFVKGESFGVRHGIGAILTAKIPLHKSGNLRANVSVSYNKFSSKFNKTLTNAVEYNYMKYNVFSGIAGIENNFTPKYRIKTYIGIGVIGSLIYGDGRITDNVVTTDIYVLPAFRLGLSINSGLEYMLTNQIGFNCGVRFTHANLWLKKSKVSYKYNEVYLNDERTDSKIPYSGFKQFAWGSFFAGVNYFFGINQKEYVFTRR